MIHLQTSKELAILLGQVGDNVTISEGEYTSRRLSCILFNPNQNPTTTQNEESTHPFHAIPRSNLTKHRLVIENRRIRSISQLRVIRRSSKIQLPLLRRNSMKLQTTCTGFHSRRRDQRNQRAENSKVRREHHPFPGIRGRGNTRTLTLFILWRKSNRASLVHWLLPGRLN